MPSATPSGLAIVMARVEPAVASKPTTSKCHHLRKLVGRFALPLSGRIGAVTRHAVLDAVTTTPAVSMFIDSPGTTLTSGVADPGPAPPSTRATAAAPRQTAARRPRTGSA